MTQSFILMALGIGIGYSITLWLQRSRGTSVPAIGPITEMQSIAHETPYGEAGHKSTSGISGGIGKFARDSGAEIVMFVDKDGKLVVVDTETGKPLPEFEDSQHEHHPAEIRFNEAGEPVLYDMDIGEPMVVHEKPYFRDFRIPVANPKSKRYIDANVVYFWRFRGSNVCCTWSGGSHVVRTRR
ncbi:MAG: hypothetical protein ACREYC_28630 [Gammaproteobacteria bacterium]